MLKQFHSRLNTGKDWYNTYRKEFKLLSNITIKNKLLAKELEQECNKKAGILTYAEYLAIDQFGENGYYAKSNKHGKTDIENRWADALVNYCKKYDYDTIIEFGCGTGELGVTTVKKYKKQTQQELNWIGVEIDTKIHTTIYNNFAAQSLQDSVKQIVGSLEELKSWSNALLVFPYSLDNIPPQVFLNTLPDISYPNAMLGIVVRNGKLTEVFIPPDILKKKGIVLENGIYSQNSSIINLTTWKLRNGQRAYIPTEAFATLYQYVKTFNENPSVIIIDEFRQEPWFFNLGNLGVPKSLYEKNLLANDRKRYYHESGKHNFYYPLYQKSLLQFLHAIGFQSIDYEIEQKLAAQLGGNRWIPLRKKYATFAFIASHLRKNKITSLPIPFHPQKLF